VDRDATRESPVAGQRHGEGEELGGALVADRLDDITLRGLALTWGFPVSESHPA